MGEKLCIQVDHIDGNSSNNLKENLRFLCPNCHSQTHNYAGKKVVKPQKQNKPRLPKEFTSIRRRKVIWPNKESLETLVWEIPSTQIAKQYGVSDSAVVKWCKKYGISKPSRGYWKKNMPS